MGSVYVRWTGRCVDEEVRTQLLDKLREFARLSHSYFEEFAGFQNFYRTLDGRILISPDLLEGTGLRLPAEAHAPGGIELRAAGPLGPAKPAPPNQFLTASHVFLEGLEFRLYDGRRLYPGARIESVSFLPPSGNTPPSMEALFMSRMKSSAAGTATMRSGQLKHFSTAPISTCGITTKSGWIISWGG